MQKEFEMELDFRSKWKGNGSQKELLLETRSQTESFLGYGFEIQIKDDMFGYVAASPDKSYLIAVGLR